MLCGEVDTPPQIMEGHEGPAHGIDPGLQVWQGGAGGRQAVQVGRDTSQAARQRCQAEVEQPGGGAEQPGVKCLKSLGTKAARGTPHLTVTCGCVCS